MPERTASRTSTDARVQVTLSLLSELIFLTNPEVRMKVRPCRQIARAIAVYEGAFKMLTIHEKGDVKYSQWWVGRESNCLFEIPRRTQQPCFVKMFSNQLDANRQTMRCK